MIEIIYISLAITIYLVVDDYIFSATLKKTHPLTSQQLYLDCTVDEEPDHYNGFADEWEDYCNWRMNRKTVHTAPATEHRSAIKFFQE